MPGPKIEVKMIYTNLNNC